VTDDAIQPVASLLDENGTADPAADGARLVAPVGDGESARGAAGAELSPFMRQWTAAKRENPDALLFSGWEILRALL